MSFVDVNTICKDKTFTISAYRNTTFGRVYNILTAFYHLPIRLVLFTHSLIDASEYAKVGLNYTLN